ncbi:uncharacterized protein LOC144490789, partial [Mustelus asterias]
YLQGDGAEVKDVDKRSELRDRGELPPPPPPPPQEAKPTRNGARSGRPQHGETAVSEACRDSGPSGESRLAGPKGRDTETDGRGSAGSDILSRSEADKERRRILVPPTTRIPGMEKRPRDRLPASPLPPPPPPAEWKPRLEEEVEEEEEEEEGGTRESPPPAMGPPADGETTEGDGAALSEATEIEKPRKPPIKPRRSKRGQYRPKLISDNSTDSEVSSGKASQTEQPGVAGDNLVHRSSSLRISQRPLRPKLGAQFPSFDGRLLSNIDDEGTQRLKRPPLRQKPATVCPQSAGDQRHTPRTDTTRFAFPEEVFDVEENRSQSDV